MAVVTSPELKPSGRKAKMTVLKLGPSKPRRTASDKD
jgi:hypothetical protein